MWIYNDGKWTLPTDKLSRDGFDTYQQDLEDVRYYSKCLSGAVFNNVSDLNNLFPILNYASKDWESKFVFSKNSNLIGKDIINNDLSFSEYSKSLEEYNFTLKGYFNPSKYISNFLNNFNYVDIASVESIDLTLEYINLYIDGVRVKDGQTILVKNQIETIILDNNIDPSIYFNIEYNILSTNNIQTEYSIPSVSNGIYIYKNLKLEKINIYNYKDVYNLTYIPRLGSQVGNQYIITRLNDGHYPMLDNQNPVLFKLNKNYLVRSQMDYNNLLDVNYYDVIYDVYENIERYIYVGEFGSILVNQQGYSNFIENDYKIDLKKIVSVGNFYYVVGDKGTLLRVDKKHLTINKVDINCHCSENRLISNLVNISFYNPNLGVIVGSLNTILITEDGGNKWERLNINSFTSFNYNKSLWINNSKFYVAGNNGVYIEFNKINDKWVPTQKKVSKKIDEQEEFILTDNIYDLLYFNTDNWSPTFSYDDTLLTNSSKELILISCSNGILILHDINNSIPDHEFIYLELNKNYGDIKSITKYDDVFYFTGTDVNTLDSGIYSFDINEFKIIGQDDDFSNISIYESLVVYESDLYGNTIYNKNNTELLIAGNNGLHRVSQLGSSLDFFILDQTLYERLKSKLLFLNYEIASKLNFFTDDGVYRLPNGINFDINIVGSQIEVVSKENELSWLDYWKDSHLSFKYYESNSLIESNKVIFNSKFTYTNLNTDNYINLINIDINEVSKLAPTIINDKYSKYDKITGLNITTPLSNDILYLNSYIMIYKVEINYPVVIGDVFRFESSILESNFIANNIIILGSKKYIYFYTDFNQNIVTNIKKINQVRLINLNYYRNSTELEYRFNKHYISRGYDLSILDNNIQIDPIFNSFTAYYNMSSIVKYNLQNNELNYENSFLKFGYTPNYNILDYLSNIDSDYFTPNKEYLSMPIYENIPYNQFTLSIDQSGNRLHLKEFLINIWNSLLINTFIDININGTIKTERLLIADKYIDSTTNEYVLVFNKKIDGYNDPISTIDIISRRKLSQISYDLNELNTIQTSLREVKLDQSLFNTYDLNNKSRFFTDSYSKILLSDKDTKEKISGVIYTDEIGNLSINITFLQERKKFNIIDISNFNNNILLKTDINHGINTGDSVTVNFTGNNSLSGYYNVTKINDNQLQLDIQYDSTITGGVLYFNIRDPFLNYMPVDLIDVGVDKKGKVAIELDIENTKLVNNIYKLVDVDFTKLRYRLIDGIDIVSLSAKYPWILEAEISNAVIGQDSDGLVWYKGIWECGRWFGGKWISGTWISGDWYDGQWLSCIIKDNYINIEYDPNKTNQQSSYWVSGRWFNGTWFNGRWFNGRWYSGVWNSGNWHSGIWNSGTWNNGTFSGGIWVNGKWNNGRFNSFDSNSYWLFGEWSGGDFENGMWYNGTFNEKNAESRFGTKSDNSRASIWQSGNWYNGSFHSRLNVVDDKYDVSLSHRYSIWNTGNWYNGSFYGGVVFNINFITGVWYGGVLEDISLIGSDIDSNTISIDGLYYFNIGYEFDLIGNQKEIEYESLGVYSDPKRYKVLKYEQIEDENITIVYVDKPILININTPSYTGIKLTSHYYNSLWKSGIWTNGIFDTGVFEGGIWLNGIFNAEWS